MLGLSYAQSDVKEVFNFYQHWLHRRVGCCNCMNLCTHKSRDIVPQLFLLQSVDTDRSSGLCMPDLDTELLKFKEVDNRCIDSVSKPGVNHNQTTSRPPVKHQRETKSEDVYSASLLLIH